MELSIELYFAPLNDELNRLGSIQQNRTEPFCNGIIDGLVQDSSNSVANALELLQSCTQLSVCAMYFFLSYFFYIMPYAVLMIKLSRGLYQVKISKWYLIMLWNMST